MNGWKSSDGSAQRTPSFTDWASAGLILKALQAKGRCIDMHVMSFNDSKWVSVEIRTDCDPIKAPQGNDLPLAVRAAALAYLREGK